MKVCGVCLKEVPALWKAKRKLPDGTIVPGECKSCANKPKPSIVAPLIELIQEMDLAVLKSNKAIQSTKNIKPISKQSDKEKKRQKLYKAVRTFYLISHPNCEAQIEGCTLQATEIHHQKGRIGDLLTNMNFFIALCHSCHEFCEHNPKQAKELGLSLNRLDKHK